MSLDSAQRNDTYLEFLEGFILPLQPWSIYDYVTLVRLMRKNAASFSQHVPLCLCFFGGSCGKLEGRGEGSVKEKCRINCV